MAYEVRLSKAAEKFLNRQDDTTFKRIAKAAADLGTDPYPAGCVKLAGSEKDFRIRVGDYRLIYEVRNEILVVLVLKIGHRKDIYR